VGPLAPNHKIVQIYLGLSHPTGVSSGPIGSSLDKIWHIHADVLPYADNTHGGLYSKVEACHASLIEWLVLRAWLGNPKSNP